jgi:hypothetical protein
MENSKKNSVSKFSFAMDSLKGILDQEGIVKTDNRDNSTTFIPTLTVNEILTDDVADLRTTSTEEDTLVKAEQVYEEQINDENVAHPPILDGTISVIDDTDIVSMELDAYIADLEDDEFDIIDLSKTPIELEEKLATITQPGQIKDLELSDASNQEAATKMLKTSTVSGSGSADMIVTDPGIKPIQESTQAMITKENIQQQLTIHIEKSIEQFKTQLISSLNDELEHLFNKKN